MDDHAHWRRRIVDAYRSHACPPDAMNSVGEGGCAMTVRIAGTAIVHHLRDDAAVEREKIAHGHALIDACRDLATPLRCQGVLRRAMRLSGLDPHSFMAGWNPDRTLIHDRGDMQARDLNLLGAHEALHPEDPEGRMISFAIRRIDGATRIALARDVVVRYDGAGRRVTLSLHGTRLSATLAATYAGRPAHEIVRHPALEGSGHLVRSVTPGVTGTVIALTPVPDRLDR